jgi:sugar/nucleoside kinase (ribokinase family)
MLVNIRDIDYAVGGCLPNTAINLAKIDRRIPISTIGKVGTDENGRYIVSTLQKYGINVSKMCYTSKAPTGFSDVMSIPSGERTFFHKKGANAEFCPDDIDVDLLNCNIFHIGYVLLLDMFDAEDKQYGTVMARFLSQVQSRGIKTSIDLVSDSSGNYGDKVIPALKYCNYLIINEIECCGIWKIAPRFDDGKINADAIRLAMQKCIDAGVHSKVVVHCKECGFSLDTKGRFTTVPSLRVPREDIKGTVGAGDAMVAGLVAGFMADWELEQCFRMGVACASTRCITEGYKTIDKTVYKAFLDMVKVERV